MARIRVNDLPKDMKVSKHEMKMILGGIDTVPLPEKQAWPWSRTWLTPKRPRPIRRY